MKISAQATFLLLTASLALGLLPTFAVNANDIGSDAGGGNVPVANNLKPTGGDSGAYVTQIGDNHVAQINQTAPSQYARITQRGNANEATADQRGGRQFAELSQQGDDNKLEVEQKGSGENMLYLSQQGHLNNVKISQNEAGVTLNAAVIFQTGNGNDLSLIQDGSDNQAALIQDGDNNVLTATQIGDANRLKWTQKGEGLSDLAIQQTGGANIQISQSNNGN